MEEEDLYKRIGEADLNPTYKDGQVYQHTDINNMLSILKTAVNENYYDIQRLQNGEESVGNAEKLDGATLSRYLDEELQANDDKIPSSQQAKAYIDALFADFSPPIRGVDYWTDEDKQQVVDEATQETSENLSDELERAKEEIVDAAFTYFDVVNGKLPAADTLLNDAKLAAVMAMPLFINPTKAKALGAGERM